MKRTAIRAIPLTTLDSTEIPAAYVIGDPESMTILPHACVYIRIVNDSTEAVFVSYDGVTDHEYVVEGTEFNFPIQSVAIPVDDLAMMAKGTNIYFRGTSGAGNITVSGYYL
jgi:hypothetical protein